jgi:hypothetical protein
VNCDYAPTTDTVTARLVARHSSTATYALESVTPSSGDLGALRGPALRAGQQVDVHYPSDQARFLRVGHRYDVSLWWINGKFQSGVHVASDVCSTGTLNADGSKIDTASALHHLLKWIVTALIVLPVLALVILAAITRRRHRRGRRPPESDPAASAPA